MWHDVFTRESTNMCKDSCIWLIFVGTHVCDTTYSQERGPMYVETHVQYVRRLIFVLNRTGLHSPLHWTQRQRRVSCSPPLRVTFCFLPCWQVCYWINVFTHCDTFSPLTHTHTLSLSLSLSLSDVRLFHFTLQTPMWLVVCRVSGNTQAKFVIECWEEQRRDILYLLSYVGMVSWELGLLPCSQVSHSDRESSWDRESEREREWERLRESSHRDVHIWTLTVLRLRAYTGIYVCPWIFVGVCVVICVREEPKRVP